VLKFKFVKPDEFTEPPTGSQPETLAPGSAAILAASVRSTLKLFALRAHAGKDARAPINSSE
jgi:hypothetical protein